MKGSRGSRVAFTPEERKSVFAIAGVYALRMFGLFLILPVFALYATQLAHATPEKIGMALGAYGLAMALLQIPLGRLSDRIGRKPVIIAGLVVFAIGSIIAVTSRTIEGVIAGRAIQGAGAISAALTALLADLTREEVRLSAMATIGMTIGLAFAGSLVLAPWLDAAIGVPGIFWLTALFAALSVLVVAFVIPTPPRIVRHAEAEAAGDWARVLGDADLLRLDFGIFALHAGMTAIFVALPFVLQDRLGLPSIKHPWVYLPVLVAALAVMVPFIIVAEKRGKMKEVYLLAIAGVGASALLLAHAGTMAAVVFALWVFFLFYNVLEATLPSWISRAAPLSARGTAMGVYSSAQFLGAFAGGALGGWAHARWGEAGVFLAVAALMGLWLVIALSQRPPRMLATRMLHLARDYSDARAAEEALLAVPGVVEAFVDWQAKSAILRVDPKALDEEALAKAAGGEG